MQPEISVGILSAEKIHFSLNGNFSFEGKDYISAQTLFVEAGKIRFDDNSYEEIIFIPADNSATFDLHEVIIGIGFHWERRETQRFTGKLKIIVENEKLTAINVLPLEDYLLSVISSEMSATSSLELLKAHAVTSRSWLLAQLSPLNPPKGDLNSPPSEGAGEAIKWYDKDDHTNFDVCADDHCQRYQGITRATSDAVRQAIDATRGEVLMYNGQVCDARFSKCCGGTTELFENCWQPEHYPYLVPVEDSPKGVKEEKARTLTSETAAENFILNTDETHFCNTSEVAVLRQVLNDYDRETADFYRWNISYSQKEIVSLLHQKSGIDFGEIVDLIPVERGSSGRLIKLKIIGTKRTITVGKELEIRRWLSESHLYSSAFVVEKEEIKNNIPQRFILRGAGWGHGVGLCQIGAAVMAEKGYAYQDILLHYFRNAELERFY